MQIGSIAQMHGCSDCRRRVAADAAAQQLWVVHSRPSGAALSRQLAASPQAVHMVDFHHVTCCSQPVVLPPASWGVNCYVCETAPHAGMHALSAQLLTTRRLQHIIML
jgi:hypothetical protein